MYCFSLSFAQHGSILPRCSFTKQKRALQPCFPRRDVSPCYSPCSPSTPALRPRIFRLPLMIQNLQRRFRLRRSLRSGTACYCNIVSPAASGTVFFDFSVIPLTTGSIFSFNLIPPVSSKFDKTKAGHPKFSPPDALLYGHKIEFRTKIIIFV